MKKKRLAHNFLIADRVLNIIGLVVFVILPIVLVVVGAVLMAKGDFNGNEEQNKQAIAGLSVIISGVTTFCVGVPFSIVALVFNGIAMRGLNNAKTKAEGRRPAIFGIIGGALLGTFGIPAGIIMLVMSDADYRR